MQRVTSLALIAGLALAGLAATPHEAKAWWRGGYGVGVWVPPVYFGPPVYAAPSVAYGLGYYPPPGYYGPPGRLWVPPHWEGPYWIRGHWR